MPSNLAPSESAIRTALAEFQLEANPNQIAQIQEYIKLLLMWNEKMNLTAIRDPLDILHRHFCESMFVTTLLDLRKCRLVDIGTGGGFPGLALRILLPDAQMVLVESSVKKATFLAEVVRTLGLGNVNVLVSRYEELGEEITPIDYVCARALGGLGAFLGWAASRNVDAKHVVLWLGASDIEEAEKSTKWTWEAPTAIPKSLRRVILTGTAVPAS
jgi:16S rRNA (guanine527-N7)-methyltransferase